jgi:hypothetical protein
LAQVTQLAPVLDQVVNKLFFNELALFVVVGCKVAQTFEHTSVHQPVCQETLTGKGFLEVNDRAQNSNGAKERN